MMKSKNPLSSATQVDKELAYMIEDSLFRINRLLDDPSVPSRRKLIALKQIHAYLQKKGTELDPKISEERYADLRTIRKILAHGRIDSNFELEPLYPELWKAIVRLSNRLGPSEIENLLAYTLDVSNLKASSKGASPTKIVGIYKRFFESLEPQYQRKIFSELLLTLFSDSESISLLNFGNKE